MADTKIATLRKLQSTLDKQIDEYETLTKRDGVSPLQLARSEERINAVADDIVSQTTNHFRGALQAGHAVSLHQSSSYRSANSGRFSELRC